MAIIVGNLLSDPNAQSFISLSDAMDYMEPERNPMWDAATVNKKEAALVCASRWLAMNYTWKSPLTPAELVRIGRIATRIAADTIDIVIMKAEDVSGDVVKSERFGDVSFTYQDRAPDAHAAGMRWPWLGNALKGLTYDSGRGSMSRFGVLVV